MEEQLVGTLEYGDLRADVYNTALPGEFKVVYRNSAGALLEEVPLTGISSYKQRESEIIDRMRQLSEGTGSSNRADFANSGEY